MTRKVVLAVDGDSDSARGLIEWAANNLNIRGKKTTDDSPPEVHLTVLYVTIPPKLPDWGFHALFTGDKLWEDILVENQKRAADAAVNLRDLLSRLDLPGEVEMRPGDPREVISKYVKADGTDLLVVGSRGLSGAAGMLMGSVSSYLVTHANCSVVVYRGVKAEA